MTNVTNNAINALIASSITRNEEKDEMQDRIDTIWEAYGDLFGTDIASDERHMSLCWGQGHSAQEYRWLGLKEVSTSQWDKEMRWEALRELFQKAHRLFKETEGTPMASKAAYLRVFLWGKARDLSAEMAKVQPEEEDLEEKGKMASSWERGQVMLEWLAKHAEDMEVKELIKWGKDVKKRRYLEDSNVNKLSYAHYVGIKIILEGLLAEKAYGKVQRVALESVEKKINEYVKHDIANRLDGKGVMEFKEEMDSEASYFGTQLSHSRWASLIDLKRRISDDEMVLEGYLLCGDEGLGLQDNLENSIGQCVIALTRCEGDKTEAAKLLNMHSSTFRSRIKKAKSLLMARLESGEISDLEHTAALALIS